MSLKKFTGLKTFRGLIKHNKVIVVVVVVVVVYFFISPLIYMWCFLIYIYVCVCTNVLDASKAIMFQFQFDPQNYPLQLQCGPNMNTPLISWTESVYGTHETFLVEEKRKTMSETFFIYQSSPFSQGIYIRQQICILNKMKIRNKRMVEEIMVISNDHFFLCILLQQKYKLVNTLSNGNFYTHILHILVTQHMSRM